MVSEIKDPLWPLIYGKLYSHFLLPLKIADLIPICDKCFQCNFMWYCFVNYLWQARWPLCVMVRLLPSSVVDCGFKTRSRQTKDCKIGICFLSTKHAALRSKSQDWLGLYQDNVFLWSNMSTHCISKLAL